MLGWWLVARRVNQSQEEWEGQGSKQEVGYISGDYLKPYKPHNELTLTSSEEDIQQYLGFVCKVEVEPAANTMPPKYIAIEEYNTKDSRQLCLRKGETVLVIEKSEDGKNALSPGLIFVSAPKCRDTVLEATVDVRRQKHAR